MTSLWVWVWVWVWFVVSCMVIRPIDGQSYVGQRNEHTYCSRQQKQRGRGETAAQSISPVDMLASLMYVVLLVLSRGCFALLSLSVLMHEFLTPVHDRPSVRPAASSLVTVAFAFSAFFHLPAAAAGHQSGPCRIRRIHGKAAAGAGAGGPGATGPRGNLRLAGWWRAQQQHQAPAPATTTQQQPDNVSSAKGWLLLLITSIVAYLTLIIIIIIPVSRMLSLPLLFFFLHYTLRTY